MVRKLPVLMAVILIPVMALAQGPAKIGVVDFERAVVESVEGKKAAEKFNLKFEERRQEIEKKQKEFEQLENRLRTQDRALSDAAKTDLSRDIDRRRTELTRLNEDAQKELGTYREELLGPIAAIANKIINAYAVEQGYSIIVDLSNPQNNVVYANDLADITTELIRRIDAETAKQPPAPAKK